LHKRWARHGLGQYPLQVLAKQYGYSARSTGGEVEEMHPSQMAIGNSHCLQIPDDIALEGRCSGDFWQPYGEGLCMY
jgi:hypothetical protein